MALAYKITKEVYDKLPADVQKEYTAKGDDYALDVTGLEDSEVIGAALRAKDHEKAKRQELAKELAAAKEANTALQSEFDEFKTKTPDVATLEAKWQKKYNDAEAKHAEELKSRDGNIQRMMVDNVADAMSREISKTPSLVKPIIAARLGVHYGTDGVATTKVLDADGELSATTLDELKAEFRSNPEYADIMIGSSGSGGGSNGSNGGGKPGKEKPNMLTASAKEIAEYLKTQHGDEGNA